MYLDGIEKETRILGDAKWNEWIAWIDASYAVYNNMQSQIGGAMSFSLDVAYGQLSKKKWNQKVQQKPD